MGQLLKLPVLIHHFLEHHNHEAGTSFIAFLHEHYDEENSHPSTNEEHEKMPFKSHSDNFSQSTFVFQSPIGFEYRLERAIPNKEKVTYSEDLYSASALSLIWQPPRYC